MKEIMPKLKKKIFTEILYVSVQKTSNDWAKKSAKKPGYSKCRYVDELIQKDMKAVTRKWKSVKTGRIVNFG